MVKANAPFTPRTITIVVLKIVPTQVHTTTTSTVADDVVGITFRAI